MSPFENLKPRLVWQFFEEITRIPRPSKHEEKIREYLISFAQSHKLEYRTDQTGNVLIIKPATETKKNSPTIVLQSHMDMVCEKNSDVKFDFMKDPIVVKVVDGWVKAEGTTLGADCGIGIAAQLAVLVTDKIEHPRIEALFTVDEETGLTGAFGLSGDMLSGQYLLNLDSEDEGEIFIGCAGGIDTIATFNYTDQAPPEDYSFYKLSVSGLCGGHSGDNINDGLANSNKLLTRILWQALQRWHVKINRMDGGNLRNAIPREAYVVVGIPDDAISEFEKLVVQYTADFKHEFAYTEPKMHLAIEKTDLSATDRVIDDITCGNLLYALQGVANGVLAMSRAMPGLVETSTNLASVKFTDGNTITVVSSQRSSIESAKYDAAATIESVFATAGAKIVHSEGYPGWAPDPASQLLKITRDSYVKLFRVEPKVRAIHAGLECGLFLKKYPHLQMVSFGPTLRGVHSPDERMEIATVDKFWKLLVDILQTA